MSDHTPRRGSVNEVPHPQLIFSFAVAALTVNAAWAGPIPISGYGVGDALLSGHGNWFHVFDGTITPEANFLHLGLPGTKAQYSGIGSGTLNDGRIGTSPSDAQLFITPAASDGTPLNPSIGLTFSFAYAIETIEIYGGDMTDNAIPGSLTDVTVTLVGPLGIESERFALEPFGILNSVGVPVIDRVNLVGSRLEGYPAFLVILSDFSGTFADWFSATEIRLDGEFALTLEVFGNCPGEVELRVNGATPGGTVAFIYAQRDGTAIIPTGICAGVQLGLDRSAQLIATDVADNFREAKVLGRAPGAVCGGRIQALDVSTCRTTNVAGF